MIGSIFFMVAGIIILREVMKDYENLVFLYKWYYPPTTIAVLMIIGSIFYTIHAILYPFALYKKALHLTSLQVVKIGLFLIVLTKFGFGLLFTVGWVYHHTNQYDEAIKFCLGGELSTFKCWVQLKGGLLISGAILLLFSIILEAFQVNNIFTNVNITAATTVCIIGSIVFIAASMYQVLYTDRYFLFFVNSPDDIEASLWIFGSLATCLGHAYFVWAWQTRSSDGSLFLTLTYSFAILGSFLLMIGGILMLEAVGNVDMNDFRSMNEYVNTVVGFMISGSVFYFNHALLHPMATYEKLIASTSDGVDSDSAAVSSNPNAVNLQEESNDIHNVSKDEEEQ
ncbi:predicted protein [Chaetoceros tenuissimus]|uniref:Uncharacterized protein n=1 Tax=Chaetoceros tenuissimus TaxID=426638 RepID=A0AAD3D3U8_9STRA|nr:predicted protein [Chaetoceros tenuissimus]